MASYNDSYHHPYINTIILYVIPILHIIFNPMFFVQNFSPLSLIQDKPKLVDKICLPSWKVLFEISPLDMTSYHHPYHHPYINTIILYVIPILHIIIIPMFIYLFEISPLDMASYNDPYHHPYINTIILYVIPILHIIIIPTLYHPYHHS